MIRKHHSLCIALSCMLATASTPAMAAKKIKLKAGLWQIDSRFRLYGHDVPSVGNIIALGPETLKTHVQNMLLQNHMRINEDGTATICVTREQIAKNKFVHDENSGCRVGNGVRTGNTIHYDIHCDFPKGSGHTEVTIIDRTRWVASSSLQLTVRGINQNVANESMGTWLSATCPPSQ
jgi:hypothetical protein